jgi:hypothetical protein
MVNFYKISYIKYCSHNPWSPRNVKFPIHKMKKRNGQRIEKTVFAVIVYILGCIYYVKNLTWILQSHGSYTL